ncbi:hypothetical protein [Agarivorans sp. QJM3NY_25]|uniref:hypothetical protein n=1 Tax=Agarivorans sp. QJM3NY_25 TaxID=3421430 RepID=UPI003D7C9DD0
MGNAIFKTAMPKNVTHISGCLRYICSKQESKFSDPEVTALTAKLEELKLKRGFQTSLKHKTNVRELVAEKAVRGNQARLVQNVGHSWSSDWQSVIRMLITV